MNPEGIYRQRPLRTLNMLLKDFGQGSYSVPDLHNQGGRQIFQQLAANAAGAHNQEFGLLHSGTSLEVTSTVQHTARMLLT